ncbi:MULTISPECIES: hypothetical protein [unclassified Pseudomonas]|uniref:hypothetical protein n=1 Tax=unclassified Pseudomonas TaxID=196821 RepID=UPI0015A0C56D|nr:MULTISPECIES: hypothetical protein [unclassified Pseudomonas]NWC94373.1 hypothetical protein [Pseudomonas sp. IPO3779]NWD18934.1 hypothetical protein [Pseudomonas sp. IPO3778]
MKTTLLGSMLVALGVASSLAVAAGFSPPGPFSGTNGSVVLKLPSTFQAPMTCDLSLSGAIDANGVAIIGTTHVLSATHQAMSGYCTVVSLNATLSGSLTTNS